MEEKIFLNWKRCDKFINRKPKNVGASFYSKTLKTIHDIEGKQSKMFIWSFEQFILDQTSPAFFG